MRFETIRKITVAYEIKTSAFAGIEDNSSDRKIKSAEIDGGNQ